MVTYYAAQLGISLSCVDSKASYLDSLRDNKPELSHHSQPTTDNEDESHEPSLYPNNGTTHEPSLYPNNGTTHDGDKLIQRHNIATVSQ